jgi:septal ring factor EnvC (AmiA/AmiB activator)
VYAVYLDRDRSSVEREAGRLEEEGQWLAAADLLADRRARPASAAYVLALAHRECLDLVHAAAESPDAQAAQAVLLRAREVAAATGVRTPLIDALHARMDLATQLAATEKETQSLTGELRTLRDRRATEDRKTATRIHALAEALHAAFLSCGDETQLPSAHRRAYYEKALEVARANSLDGNVAQARLRDIAELLAKLVPMALPPGSVIQVVGASTPRLPRSAKPDDACLRAHRPTAWAQGSIYNRETPFGKI